MLALLSQIGTIASTPTFAFSGFSFALDLPIWPMKVIMWGLFAFSLLCWSIIISKSVSFYRGTKGDNHFLEELNLQGAPLDFYSKVRRGWNEFALRAFIYRTGAKELCFQLMGSYEVDETLGARIERSGLVNPSQFAHVRTAIYSAERVAVTRLKAGFTILSVCGALAPMLGGIGCAWVMMKGYESAAKAGSGLIQAEVSAAGWAVLMTSLYVALPAILARMIYGHLINNKAEALRDFSNELTKALDKHFLKSRSEVSDEDTASIKSLSAPIRDLQPIERRKTPRNTPIVPTKSEEPDYFEPAEPEEVEAEAEELEGEILPLEPMFDNLEEVEELSEEPVSTESPFELVEEEPESIHEILMRGKSHHQPALGLDDSLQRSEPARTPESAPWNTTDDDEEFDNESEEFEIEPEINPIARQVTAAS